MSLAVDYWDYLGWKDTLALSGHTNRQRAYAKARGDREVYTPQVVIDGAVARARQRQGCDRARSAATRKAQELGALAASCRSRSQHAGDIADGHGGRRYQTVDVQDEKGQAEAIWLCPITKSVPVVIGRGENSGHTITYTNVVRRWIKLGDWTGKAETSTCRVQGRIGRSTDVDLAAVMVQAALARARS